MLARVLHHKRSQLSADEAGFTLIEVLVASSVLVIALLGLFLMVDVAAKTSRVTSGREGAVNLAREITEDARAVPYAQITSSGIVAQLQSMPGLANQSGGGSWQIVRRGVTYTITVTESDLAAVTNQTIPQKQVSVAVSWTASGVTHSFSETATMSSAAQGVGL